ncbi:sporulation phosphorelay system protein KapB [Gorillibacterium massiliense]|uniref:sporulation phosphorelay system protein KapB n=1 Tax=Gorillibacterium massiliense TaxID=1280390 RepID=UPI0004B7BAE2|nr:sporulation phosphorelay system protein KapB [Gorillibacterium massiliense]
MSIIAVGDKVRAVYKSGEYVAEVVELTDRRAAVKVLAVLKHPAQGDLHKPHHSDIGFFHQRRALALNETIIVPLPTIVFHIGPVPDYKQSLKEALESEVASLKQQKEYADRSLHELAELKKDYFH